MKKCPSCQKEKPLKDFYNNRSSPDGKHTYCKPCWYAYCYGNAPEERKEKFRRYVRKGYLMRTYGITLDEYDLILKNQENGCAICEKTDDPNKRLAVDHDKLTGRIRGILCENCNRGIGLLRHDVRLLEEAIIYLKKIGPS